MHKLIIMVGQLEDNQVFEGGWPQFLHLIESMPELRKETTSRVEGVIYGNFPYTLIHELYFDTFEAIQRAMASPEGRSAGKLLQAITQGQLALMFADHREDELENIRRFTESDQPHEE